MNTSAAHLRALTECGVYAIRNTQNGKVYIGSTIRRVLSRWASHRSALNAKKHSNRSLQADWDEFGESSFEFSVLESQCLASILRSLEQRWIDEYILCGVECYNAVRVYAGVKKTKKGSPKNPKNFRLSADAIRWLCQLSDVLSISQAAVLEIAIREKAEREGLKEIPQ